MNSVISEMPGPEVAVKARAPFQDAPITIPIEASSSSPWTMAYLAFPVSASWRSFLQYLEKASASDDDGVIGYQAHTVAPPYTQPRAAAALPSMKILLPTFADFFTFRPSESFRCSLAWFQPIWKAFRLGLSGFSLPLY